MVTMFKLNLSKKNMEKFVEKFHKEFHKNMDDFDNKQSQVTKMNIKDEVWNDDNNIKLVFDNNTSVGITIEDIEHFIKFLDSNNKFYYFNNNDKRRFAINKSKINFIIFKEGSNE